MANSCVPYGHELEVSKTTKSKLSINKMPVLILYFKRNEVEKNLCVQGFPIGR